MGDDECDEEEEADTVAGNYDPLACVGASWGTSMLCSTHGDDGRKRHGARRWLWSLFQMERVRSILTMGAGWAARFEHRRLSLGLSCGV